jgi:hypothetical protein
MKQDLREWGFPQDNYTELRCRICNSIIHKHGITILLGTTVKYGYCRWYTHGVSLVKLMK